MFDIDVLHVQFGCDSWSSSFQLTICTHPGLYVESVTNQKHFVIIMQILVMFSKITITIYLIQLPVLLITYTAQSFYFGVDLDDWHTLLKVHKNEEKGI